VSLQKESSFYEGSVSRTEQFLKKSANYDCWASCKALTQTFISSQRNPVLLAPQTRDKPFDYHSLLELRSIAWSAF
jgi:hypothetical protein